MIKTKVRTGLLEIFSQGHPPLSATDVMLLLKNQGISANKTTIYRELPYLVQQGVIREVMWDDSVVRYEQQDPHCHHHVVCKGCGTVSPVNIDEELLLTSVEKQSGFTITKHIVEFFGHCTNCS